MGKVNLAMQNQFVEFAKKDGEGKDIAETFAGVDSAIEQLATAIGDVIGFKGILTITTGPNTLNVIPDEPGMYRLNNGYAVVLSVGADARRVMCHAYGAPNGSYFVYSGNKGATNVSPTSSDTFAFASDIKPIYWHTLKFQRGGSPDVSTSRVFGNMIVINNSSTPITLAAWKEMLAIDGFVGVVLNGGASSAPGNDLGGCSTATRIRNLTDTTFEVYGLDPDNNSEILLATNMSIDTGWVLFQDLGVNRIN